MPIINHQQVLDDIQSQAIEFTADLDVNSVQLEHSNEILLNANQVNFNDAEIVQKLLTDLTQLKAKSTSAIGLIVSGELDFLKIKPFLADIFAQVSVIAINFSGFRDGRGYSFAKSLTNLPYFPEHLVLRATGGIIADSLPFLKRVGFTQFDISDDIFKPSFFEQFDSIQHFYDGQNSQVLPMFAKK